jgi:hypothetical protein
LILFFIPEFPRKKSGSGFGIDLPTGSGFSGIYPEQPKKPGFGTGIPENPGRDVFFCEMSSNLAKQVAEILAPTIKTMVKEIIQEL